MEAEKRLASRRIPNPCSREETPLSPSQRKPGTISLKAQKALVRWKRNPCTDRDSDGRLGNRNARKHGIYTCSFQSEEERALHRRIIQGLNEDLNLNGSSDQMQVETVAVSFVHLMRAVDAGHLEAMEKYDQMIRANLRDLRATRLARGDGGLEESGPTLAQWATLILEKNRTAEQVPAHQGSLEGPSPRKEEPKN